MLYSLPAWHVAMCVAAAINIAIWACSARLVERANEYSADVWATRRLVVWLSAGYVLGCAFRSVLPMLDEPRVCLHDTVVSRIAVGRSVATIAEICFAAQWALLLREAGSRAQVPVATFVASLLLPLAVAAEVFSWFAVLTRNNLLHAIENSFWTLGAALALCAVLLLREAADERGRRALMAVAVGILSYLGFMVVVDVPMYLARWQTSAAAGVPAPSIAEGWAEIIARCQVVRDLSTWSADLPWLTLYFSVAVWASISLAHLRPIRRSALPRSHRRQSRV